MAPDDRGLYDTPGLACEAVVWRLSTHSLECDVIGLILYELPTHIQ